MERMGRQALEEPLYRRWLVERLFLHAVRALLLATLLALPAGAGAAPRVMEKQFALAGSGSTRVRGTVAPGTEDAWSFRIGRGKDARVRIVAGAKQVVCDLYDGQSLAANEGVDEEDWFPVSPGPYRLVVNNVTGLGTKGGGRAVSYVIEVEVR